MLFLKYSIGFKVRHHIHHLLLPPGEVTGPSDIELELFKLPVPVKLVADDKSRETPDRLEVGGAAFYGQRRYTYFFKPKYT